MNTKTVSTFLKGFGILFAVIGFIMFEVSVGTAQDYFDTVANGGIIALFIVGILLCIGNIVLSYLNIANKIVKITKEILLVAACLCFGYMIGLIIGCIATEFAYTYLSDFNAATEKAQFIPKALTQAIVGVVMTLISIVVVSVEGIFNK